MNPTSADEIAEALRGASASATSVRCVGGGTKSRRGTRAAAGAVLSTTGLDRIVEHTPAELTVTVEAGLAATALAERLTGAGQWWPQAQIVPGATVGGILAAGASGRRRLRHGPVRDSLLEVVLVTGDGRIVKGGGRTVKGVAGYDLPRLAVGSLGTLGVIAQVTLKLSPLPSATGWFAAEADLADRAALAGRLRSEVWRPAAMLLTPGRLSVELMGAEADVVAPAGMVPATAPPEPEGRGLMDLGVPPSAVPDVAAALEAERRPFVAELGVGVVRAAIATPDDVIALRALATRHGGHGVVVDGPDDLRDDPWGPAPAGAPIMRRLKQSFDPAGILGPGAFAGAVT